MFQKKFVVILFILLAGCGNTDSKHDHASKFYLLDGADCFLYADRISNQPDVQFPDDILQESDYEPTEKDIQYDVSFSDDGKTVTIEPGSIHGHKILDGEDTRFYDFDDGEFAGGRFVIWIYSDHFEAELTIYGSGVPIIESKRGDLEIYLQST